MNERVTITLPEEIVRCIERQERNRSKFILQAVKHELERRRMEELRRSLRNPHPESDQAAQAGIAEWMDTLPKGDEDLVDSTIGENIQWIPGEGWVKGE